MKTKQVNMKLTYFLVALFFIAIVTISFALPSFLVTLEGQNLNKINTCSLELNVKEGEAITLLDTFPMSYSDAQSYDPFTVTVTKTGNCSDITYKLSMISSCDDCTLTDGICTIDGNTCDCNNQIDSSLIDYQLVNTNTGETITGTNPYTLELENTFSEDEEEIVYEIKLWINENATNDDIYVSTTTTPYTAKDFCVKIKVGTDDESIPTVSLVANKKDAGTAVATNVWSNEGLNFTLTAGNVGESDATIYYCKDTTNTCNPATVATSGTAITSYNGTTGTYYIRYKVENETGTSTTSSYTAKVDTAAPTCTWNVTGIKATDSEYYYTTYNNGMFSTNSTIEGNLQSDWYYIGDSGVTYELACSDDLSGVDDSHIGNSSYAYTSYDTNVERTITGYAADKAGNTMSTTKDVRVAGRGLIEPYIACPSSMTYTCELRTNNTEYSSHFSDTTYYYCESTAVYSSSCSSGGYEFSASLRVDGYNGVYDSVANNVEYYEKIISDGSVYKNWTFISSGVSGGKSGASSNTYIFIAVPESGLASYPLVWYVDEPY